MYFIFQIAFQKIFYWWSIFMIQLLMVQTLRKVILLFCLIWFKSFYINSKQLFFYLHFRQWRSQSILFQSITKNERILEIFFNVVLQRSSVKWIVSAHARNGTPKNLKLKPTVGSLLFIWGEKKLFFLFRHWFPGIAIIIKL